MALRLEALIERWDSTNLLYVRSLPGFIVEGNSSAELRNAVAGSLKAHLEWLVERELIEQPGAEVDLAVVEDLIAKNGIGPRFLADLLPPTADEVEQSLAVGRAALSDLIDAFDALGDERAGAKPLRHVAKLDRWYASRIASIPNEPTSTDPVDELVASASIFEDVIDQFDAGTEPEVFVRDGEEWSLAKSLRRRTAHLREHLIDLMPGDAET